MSQEIAPQHVSSPLAPVTEAAFFATRLEFFHNFNKFALYSTITVLVIVALMGIFLG